MNRVDEQTAASVDDGDEARPERIQQSMTLPRHLRQRLRLAAVFLERQISDMAEEAISRYLDQLQRDRKSQGLAPIPEPAPEDDG